MSRAASRHLGTAGAVLAGLLGLGPGCSARSASGESRSAPPAGHTRVAPSRLSVTEGRLSAGVGATFSVDGPRLRAVVPGRNGSDVALRFTWWGATTEVRPLASGELREQLGLKLRAMDGCNVVYVMWRIAPKPGIVVNFKRNPDEHSSGECGNRGYSTVRPRRQVPVPAPRPGQTHTLRARIDGAALHVWADEALVWEGTLPEVALSFDGPAGLRTDNVRATLELFTP